MTRARADHAPDFRRKRPVVTALVLTVALLLVVLGFELVRAYGETAGTTREFARTTDATTALANVQREGLTIIAALAPVKPGDKLTKVDIRRGLLERQLEVFEGSTRHIGRRHGERLALRRTLVRFDEQLAQLRDGSRVSRQTRALPGLRATLERFELQVKELFDEEEHDLYEALTQELHRRTARQRLIVVLGAFGLLLAAGVALIVRRSIRSEFREAYDSLEAEVQERKLLQEQLSHQALHDALTGLGNRVLFREQLDAAIRVVPREPMAVLYMDLDGFKTINDSFGHEAGDELLRQTSDRLSRTLRPDDRVARLGGDEFAILLASVATPDAACLVAGRLLETVAQPFTVCGKQVHVGASIGVAIVEPHDRDSDVLLRNADLAMYAAKKDGKGAFQVFTPDMADAACARGELEEELHAALARNEFELHFQPIVDVADPRPVGFEALVRWDHPERGVLLPGAFLDVAEESGLIVPMGHWVLAESCRHAAEWLEEIGPAAPWISVNISPRQLREPALVDHVRAALSDCGLPAGQLMLEISELTMLSDLRGAAVVLSELRELGVRVALDDFGAGYSSLGYLRFLPIDVLKIDKCFVDQLAGGREGSPLAQAILRFGGQIRIETIAEGVESAEQLEGLDQAGCRYAQGYHFSRPVPAAAARDLMAGTPDRATKVA